MINYSVDKLNVLLLSLLGSEELVEKWWSSPGKAFDLDTPAEVYLSNPEKVVKYILCQIQ